MYSLICSERVTSVLIGWHILFSPLDPLLLGGALGRRSWAFFFLSFVLSQEELGNFLCSEEHE